MRIAFGCKARVGKDTCIRILCEKYGGYTLSFAKPLYDILYYTQEKVGLEPHKDREFLQLVGTTWGRSKDENIWVKALLIEYRKRSVFDNVFVSDVRFQNEFDALRAEGFTLVKVNRDDVEKVNHVSEEGDGFDWDYEIDNNGSFIELRDEIERLVEFVLCWE